jgi:hypothetical protein
MPKIEACVYLGFNPNATTIQGLNETILFFDNIILESNKSLPNVFESQKIE